MALLTKRSQTFSYIRRNFVIESGCKSILISSFLQNKTMFQTVASLHIILVLIANEQKPHLNARAEGSSGARGLIFGLSLHLLTNFVYSSSEVSGESAHVRRLAWAFVARQCDEYQNQVSVYCKPKFNYFNYFI